MSTVRARLPWSKLAPKNKRASVAQSIALHRLYTPEQTNFIIERERARTDRTGTGFSMLVITANRGQRAKAALMRVADFLATRLRLTDELGSLDDRRLCVVLPTTTPTGAKIVAEEVQKECGEAREFDFKCYYYPTHDYFQVDDAADSESESESEDHGETVPTEAMEPMFAQRTYAWKRCLDIVGSAGALVVLSPVLVITAMLVRVTSPGPVFFKQRRSGRSGVPFVMFKFRSMVVDAEQKKSSLMEFNEQDGPAFKLRSDPRVTWLGKILRATSVDELPQLLNVLKGDMSLVGPRPLPCDETAKCDIWHRRRVDVTPGMTCTWQLHGRSVVSFDEWVRMDISYIHKVSLLSDVKLIAGTLPVMLWRTTGL